MNKIYFVEETDMYRDVSYGQLAYTSEAEADQVAAQKTKEHGNIGYSYMIQELELRYSHRNGETEDTEVDGYYFVEWLGQFTIRQNPCQSQYSQPLECYYGPIPFPKL